MGDYKRSKLLAERVAEDWAGRGLPVVIVSPSTPVGEGDTKPTPTGQIIVDFLNDRMPAYVDTGLNLVDVRDVAEGHLLAAQRGRVGHTYILGNANLTLKEILELVGRTAGRRAPRLRLPHWIPLALAHLEAPLARWRGREPRIPLSTWRAHVEAQDVLRRRARPNGSSARLREPHRAGHRAGRGLVRRPGPRAAPHRGRLMILSALRLLGFVPIAAICIYRVVTLALNTRSWQMLLPRDGRPRFGTLLSLRWIGESVNNLLPVAQVGGDLARASLVTARGVPRAEAGATMMADFAIGAITQMIFGPSEAPSRCSTCCPRGTGGKASGRTSSRSWPSPRWASSSCSILFHLGAARLAAACSRTSARPGRPWASSPAA